MRTVITGATGGLGRNALEYVLHQGEEATACGRNASILAKLGRVPTVRADLSSMVLTDACRLVQNHDAIWHCAALSAPWGQYKDFLAANLTASETLFKAAGHCEVPVFVHISTPAVYFNFTHRYDLCEDQVAARPVNHYAATKLMAEQRLVELAHRYPRTKLVILRPRAIFGPYDQALFPRLLKLMDSSNGRLSLPRGGDALLDLTYVENVVHAMALATTAQVPSGSVFNISNDEPVTVRGALTQLMAELARPFSIRPVPYWTVAPVARAMEGMAYVTRKEPRLTSYSLGALAYDMTLDVSAARKDLGYQPLVGMADAYRRTAAWLRTRANG